MGYILISLLFLLGILAYVKQREWALFYYIIWSVFFPYLVSFFIFDIDTIKHVRGLSNYYIAIIFFINIVFYNKLFNLKKILGFTCVIFFVLLTGAINNVSANNYLSWSLSNIVPVFCASSLVFTMRLTKFQTLKFLLPLLFLELTIGFFQYNYLLFISPVFALTGSHVYYDNFMWGTFTNANVYMMFVSLAYFTIIILWDLKQKRDYIIFGSLTILFLYDLVFSGVRTYLLLSLVAFFLIWYIRSKKKKNVLIVGAFSALLFSSIFLVSDYYAYDAKFQDNALQRQIFGISQLKSGDMEESTLSLSSELMSEWNDYLFGEGKLYRGGYKSVSFELNNETDATLVLYMVEFGLITFFLIVCFFYNSVMSCVITDSKKFKNMIRVIFLFCLAATITDPGLFYPLNLVMIMTLATSGSNNQLPLINRR